MTSPAPEEPRPLMRRGEAIRILVMAVVLGILMIAYLIQVPGSRDEAVRNIPVRHTEIVVPQLDAALLATVRDRTRVERIQTEENVLAHLLEQSLDIVPAVAQALGMPNEPVPIANLRADPASWRGKYLWYEGTVESLAKPRSGHPRLGYKIHEAILRTRAGDAVVALFSLPSDPELKVGSFVRCEGFFMKLRDGNFPPLDEAPVLVGPGLQPAIAEREQVTELDPQVLAQVLDGRLGPDGLLADPQEGGNPLVDSQGLPLWHLASYAQHREATSTREQLLAVPPFVKQEQFYDAQLGRIPRGTPMRVLGSFIEATTMPARMNPYGFRHWSEVWIQCRDLGGRTIAVWLPDDIALSGEWRHGAPVQVHGLLFRRYYFESREGQPTVAPVFVAAKLNRFELPDDPLGLAGGIAIAGTFSLLCVFLFWNHRREQRARRDHEQQMIARRRRRRDLPTVAGTA